MAFFLLPRVLVASLMPALRILDEHGIPIVGARVMFTDASGVWAGKRPTIICIS